MKTKKLFYNQFAGKISIKYSFASDFRGAEISNLRAKFDSYINLLNSSGQASVMYNGRPRRLLNVSELAIGVKLIAILSSIKDYRIRVEGSILSIYTNDDDAIEKINNISGIYNRYVFRPESDKIKNFLLTNPRTIIANDSSFKFRVTVNPLKDKAGEFNAWAVQLPKIKLQKLGMRARVGGHFYVKDEKTLSLCHIFLGNYISKVENVVTADEI